MKSNWLLCKQLLGMRDKWEKLKKNKNRESNTERSKRKKFCEDLQKLFDIVAENAEGLIYADRLRTKAAKEEDAAFLRDQKSTRNMQISSMDYKTKSSFERKRQRVKSALEYEQQQSTFTTIDLPGLAINLISILDLNLLLLVKNILQ